MEYKITTLTSLSLSFLYLLAFLLLFFLTNVFNNHVPKFVDITLPAFGNIPIKNETCDGKYKIRKSLSLKTGKFLERCEGFFPDKNTFIGMGEKGGIKVYKDGNIIRVLNSTSQDFTPDYLEINDKNDYSVVDNKNGVKSYVNLSEWFDSDFVFTLEETTNFK
jgi:hypothetical protein